MNGKQMLYSCSYHDMESRPSHTWMTQLAGSSNDEPVGSIQAVSAHFRSSVSIQLDHWQADQSEVIFVVVCGYLTGCLRPYGSVVGDGLHLWTRTHITITRRCVGTKALSVCRACCAEHPR